MDEYSNETKPTWQAAQMFAEEHHQDFIVALLWSQATGIETVLTWGRTLEQSDGAAKLGNTLKKQLGWDPEQCTDASAKVKNLISAANAALTKFKEAKLPENAGIIEWLTSALEEVANG